MNQIKTYVIPPIAISTEEANTLIEKYRGFTQSFFDYQELIL